MKNRKKAKVAPGIVAAMRHDFLLLLCATTAPAQLWRATLRSVFRSLLCAIAATGWSQTAEERERYEKLAAQGGVEAQFNLGVIYENGQGVPKDERKAFE